MSRVGVANLSEGGSGDGLLVEGGEDLGDRLLELALDHFHLLPTSEKTRRADEEDGGER